MRLSLHGQSVEKIDKLSAESRPISQCESHALKLGNVAI